MASGNSAIGSGRNRMDSCDHVCVPQVRIRRRAVRFLAAAVAVSVLLSIANAGQETVEVTDIVTELRLAAEQGDADAQFNLGVMYANGEGVPENDAEAVKWYRLAAEQSHADAQFKLGVMYDLGNGVPENDAEAAR